MFSCPNCGNNIRFDIASQKMHCPSCDTYLEPTLLPEKIRDAQTGMALDEKGEMEVTIYTCPQCGAEMLSTDNDVTAFCSYCGASNILTERIAREKRPDCLIPFQITREDCKKAYAARMRKAVFAPSVLKKAEYIDGFRGIYMPYWSYDMTQKGEISINGVHEHRKGDYIIQDHYRLSMDADNSFKGVTHDASSSFSDRISESLAPYDTGEMKAFHTAYLSGFYADTADIDPEIYRPSQEHMAATETLSLMKKEKAFASYTKLANNNPAAATKTKTTRVRRTLFPVWFMSWQHEGRVAYSAVNGQTGKITADIPIDKKKYFLGVGLLAAVLFVLMNLFVVMKTSTVLTVSAVITTVGLTVYALVLMNLLREFDGRPDADKANEKRNKKKFDLPGGLWLGLGLAFLGLFEGIYPLILAMPVGIIISCLSYHKKLGTRRGDLSLWILMVLFALTAIVLLFSPYQDVIYYGMSAAMTVCTAACFLDVVWYHNQLMTRPLPKFDREGGEADEA